MFCSETNCKKCNQYNTCELTLPYSTGLINTQKRIQDILNKLNALDEDYNYLTTNPQAKLYGVNIESIISDRDELVEELRSLRLSEKKKIRLLRRRRK